MNKRYPKYFNILAGISICMILLGFISILLIDKEVSLLILFLGFLMVSIVGHSSTFFQNKGKRK